MQNLRKRLPLVLRHRGASFDTFLSKRNKMNRTDLYTQYAKVIELCKGTKLEETPWKGVRYDSCEFSFEDVDHHPNFKGDPAKYEFAVAVLEDKPVFVGDEIYHKLEAIKVRVVNTTIVKSCDTNTNHGININEDYFTWTPPAPKRTFTLNGVELPCPVDETSFDAMHNILHIGHCAFKFENKEDRKRVVCMLINLLTEARDK